MDMCSTLALDNVTKHLNSRQFSALSSPYVEMMGLIGMGNNPMVGATVAVAVAVQQAQNK